MLRTILHTTLPLMAHSPVKASEHRRNHAHLQPGDIGAACLDPAGSNIIANRDGYESTNKEGGSKNRPD